MRKQTKIAAIASAAALLAIGASMTALAAPGWVNLGDGNYEYHDRNDDPVYNEWHTDVDSTGAIQYYYLGDDGLMVRDEAITVDMDNSTRIYYVDSSGRRVSNQWVSFDNEDGVSVYGNEVDVLWMFFGSNGRAAKAPDDDAPYVTSAAWSGGSNTFLFNEDGYMLSGWYNGPVYTSATATKPADGTRIYYLGDENEGFALNSGWVELEPNGAADDYTVPEESGTNWYYFQGNGQAYKGETRYINGRYYTFNPDGALLDGFKPATLASASASIYADTNGAVGSGWQYDSGDNVWYYLISYRDTNNNVTRSVTFKPNAGKKKVAKVIGGKTYLFDESGKMLTGIQDVKLGEIDHDDYLGSAVYALDPGKYYFNDPADKKASNAGQMLTGRQSKDSDGEMEYYYFAPYDIKNAQGVTVYHKGEAVKNAIVDNLYYDQNCLRFVGDSGSGYELVTLPETVNVVKNKTVTGTVAAQKTIAVNGSGRAKTTGTVRIDGELIDLDALNAAE